jgi:hypothetical protein
MTLEQLIEQLRSSKNGKLEKRAEHTIALADLRGKEVQGETVDPAAVEAHRSAKSAIDAELTAVDARIADLEVELRADQAATALAAQTRDTGVRAPAYDQVHRIGQEKRTYSPETDKRGGGFLRDIASAFFGDYTARDRLERHRQEERAEGRLVERAAGTGAFAGLTVPQYLTDMYAPAAKAMRPFADLCNKHDLPPAGMTINISRITTATSTALQASENAAVSETNIDDTLLTENVQTIAGQQTLSRQALERGTGVEDVMLDDLFRSFATTLDSTLINQATTGLDAISAAAASIAYTDGTPTAAELWPKLLDARQRIESALLDTQADETVAVMHARRWAWLQSQVGPNWPFIVQNMGPAMAGGEDYGKTYGAGYRGNVAGINVVVDNNISTVAGAGTEDRIYVVNKREMHLWEDPQAPLLIRAEQPAAASLGVLFVVYGYFAYTFRRYPAASAQIQGTGLIAPTF